MHALRLLYQDCCDVAIQGHLEDSSRKTYGTGHRHFQRFCTTHGIIVSEDNPPTKQLFLYFIAHLRTTHELAASTINQYITHASTYLFETGFINAVGDIRSERSKRMLHCYAKEDSADIPLRLTLKIPLTYQLADSVAEQLHGTHDTTRHGHLRRHCDRLRLFPPPW